MGDKTRHHLQTKSQIYLHHVTEMYRLQDGHVIQKHPVQWTCYNSLDTLDSRLESLEYQITIKRNLDQ